MKTEILDNGLKIIQLETNSNTVCILVNVKVGSNYEESDVAGISHFIEHMLFEGTKKRPDSYLISNEIEKLGGEFNAATSNERTFYYIKLPAKHFEIAVDVLSDIVINPIFDEQHIEKEKGIIIDEVKLVNDQPRFYQWIFFQKELYSKHPARKPVYGKIEAIKDMNREKILSYYNKYYVPGNITVVVSGMGNSDSLKKRLSKMKKGQLVEPTIVAEPKQKNPIIKHKKKDTLQAYAILGYKTVPRIHKDSYVLDVIRAILGRGQSGKIFDIVRNKLGLAYDVGVLHNPSTDFGYMAIYVNTNKTNVEKVRDLIISEIQKLIDVTDTELTEAKTFLEGEFLMQAEDSQKMADFIAWWDQVGDSKLAFSYIDTINKVTKADVKRVVEKYFDNYVMTVLD